MYLSRKPGGEFKVEGIIIGTTPWPHVAVDPAPLLAGMLSIRGRTVGKDPKPYINQATHTATYGNMWLMMLTSECWWPN